jgi:hypothetical protein
MLLLLLLKRIRNCLVPPSFVCFRVAVVVVSSIAVVVVSSIAVVVVYFIHFYTWL